MNLMNEKKAVTQVPVHPLIAERWSPRAFSETPVEDEKIVAMLEAARWAASGTNEQPWNFVVGRKHQDPETYGKLLRVLNEGNQAWAKTAPVLIMGVMDLYRGEDQPNPYARYVVGLAVAQAVLQGLSQGVYTHQMAGFDKQLARELFGIPEKQEPLIMIAAGYPGDITQLSEINQQRESAVRERKPLRDFIFGVNWGEVHPLIKDK